MIKRSICHGGSWIYNPWISRATYCNNYSKRIFWSNNGFRVIKLTL